MIRTSSLQRVRAIVASRFGYMSNQFDNAKKRIGFQPLSAAAALA
jgi:hypothetical protein